MWLHAYLLPDNVTIDGKPHPSGIKRRMFAGRCVAFDRLTWHPMPDLLPHTLRKFTMVSDLHRVWRRICTWSLTRVARNRLSARKHAAAVAAKVNRDDDKHTAQADTQEGIGTVASPPHMLKWLREQHVDSALWGFVEGSNSVV
jgi:hypothetical protein